MSAAPFTPFYFPEKNISFGQPFFNFGVTGAPLAWVRWVPPKPSVNFEKRVLEPINFLIKIEENEL